MIPVKEKIRSFALLSGVREGVKTRNSIPDIYNLEFVDKVNIDDAGHFTKV